MPAQNDGPILTPFKILALNELTSGAKASTSTLPTPSPNTPPPRPAPIFLTNVEKVITAAVSSFAKGIADLPQFA